MNKLTKPQTALLILLSLDLLLSVCTLARHSASDKKKADSEITFLGKGMENGVKHTLFIGTNDKDTGTQLISPEEAKAKVNAICAKYTDGWTAIDALGGWKDEIGRIIDETTLVYIFYGCTDEQIQAVADETREALNQSAILIEKAPTTSIFYSGN